MFQDSRAHRRYSERHPLARSRIRQVSDVQAHDGRDLREEFNRPPIAHVVTVADTRQTASKNPQVGLPSRLNHNAWTGSRNVYSDIPALRGGCCRLTTVISGPPDLRLTASPGLNMRTMIPAPRYTSRPPVSFAVAIRAVARLTPDSQLAFALAHETRLAAVLQR